MKIKRGRLQQIIQEELSRVLKEERNEPYMVVARDPSGELVFHDASGRPNNLSPKIYDNEKDAVQFSINQTSKTKTAGSPPLYAVPVARVLRQIDDHPQRRVITDLIDDFMNKPTVPDNDLDTDNDGMISVGELEKELQDIRDDLVDMSDLPWARPDGERNIQYYMELLADKAGFRASEFVNPDSDIETSQLDALAAGFVEEERMNYETDDESGTIRVGTFKGEPVAVADTMGYQTWMR